MGLKYRGDVLEALKARGYSSYRLRSEKLLSESTIQKLREGRGVSWDCLETICRILDCQPGDLIYYERAEKPTE